MRLDEGTRKLLPKAFLQYLAGEFRKKALKSNAYRKAFDFYNDQLPAKNLRTFLKEGVQMGHGPFLERSLGSFSVYQRCSNSIQLDEKWIKEFRGKKITQVFTESGEVVKYVEVILLGLLCDFLVDPPPTDVLIGDEQEAYCNDPGKGFKRGCDFKLLVLGTNDFCGF